MNKIWKQALAALLCLSMLLGMTACGAESAPASSEPAESESVSSEAESAESAQPEKENDEVIVLGASRELAPGAKTPYYCTYTIKVWEPLIENGQDGEPQPKLATDWSSSEDFTEWTFHLRDDVTFHDGEAFNADAVIANVRNWQKFPNGKKPSPFYTFNLNTMYPGFRDIVKVDDYTVTFIFDKPVSTLPYYMTNFGSPMYSPKCFEGTEEGDFNGLPVGTGPLKLTDHVNGEYIMLERNENYWGEKSGAAKIRINIIPDANTRFAALKSGEIMGVLDLGGITPILAKELSKDPDFTVKSCLSTVPHYLSVNHKHFPLDQPKMLQAISLVIDRELINENFFGGYCFPTTNILSAASPFAKEIPIEHDVEKAKALADEVLQGRRATIDILLPSGMLSQYSYKELAEYMQATLSQIGLDVTITVMDTAAATEHRRSGKFDTVLHTSGMSNSEPFSVFESRMHSTGGTNVGYGLGYFNQEVEDLIDETRDIVDIGERRAAYDRLQDIALEELPMIPLVDGCWLIVYNNKVTDYEPERYGQSIETIRWAD